MGRYSKKATGIPEDCAFRIPMARLIQKDARYYLLPAAPGLTIASGFAH